MGNDANIANTKAICQWKARDEEAGANRSTGVERSEMRTNVPLSLGGIKERTSGRRSWETWSTEHWDWRTSGSTAEQVHDASRLQCF